MQTFFFSLIDLYSEKLDSKRLNLRNNIVICKEKYRDVITQEHNSILESMIKQL